VGFLFLKKQGKQGKQGTSEPTVRTYGVIPYRFFKKSSYHQAIWKSLVPTYPKPYYPKTT